MVYLLNRSARQYLRSALRYKRSTSASRVLRSVGAVAQLGERCVRNAEVEGSIPFRSTQHGPLVRTRRIGGPFFCVVSSVSSSNSGGV